MIQVDMVSKECTDRDTGTLFGACGLVLPAVHPSLWPHHLLPFPRLQERATPEVLIKSMARRRRVAVDSGQTEAEVTKLMGAYTAVGRDVCFTACSHVARGQLLRTTYPATRPRRPLCRQRDPVHRHPLRVSLLPPAPQPYVHLRPPCQAPCARPLFDPNHSTTPLAQLSIFTLRNPAHPFPLQLPLLLPRVNSTFFPRLPPPPDEVSGWRHVQAAQAAEGGGRPRAGQQAAAGGCGVGARVGGEPGHGVEGKGPGVNGQKNTSHA